ncbi:helix-turn-helix transcriptional regulator [Ktedonospora formicarum]|nr:AraC family transcriptional regulator [Ktedonospora formicarum]
MSESQINLRETHIVGSHTHEQIVGKQACQALSLHRIGLVGMSQARPPFRFERPRPFNSQLLLCLEGWGMILVDGEWQRCPPGTAYLTPPGVAHAYRAVEERPWSVCWVAYDDSLEQASIGGESTRQVQVDPQPLAAVIAGLYREYIGQAEPAAMQQWAELIALYAQRIIGPERQERRLQQLWEHVNQDISHDWSNEALANQLGISSEQLRRLCLQQLGESPMKYLTLLRMRRAMALLSSDSYSVEQVAMRIGYHNAFAFSTAFKRAAGVSPSAYRDQMRKSKG